MLGAGLGHKRTSAISAHRNNAQPEEKSRTAPLGAFEGIDIDFRLQRFMQGALIGDFHQPLALLIVERTLERDSAVDVIERTDLGVAGFAILSMDLAVT